MRRRTLLHLLLASALLPVFRPAEAALPHVLVVRSEDSAVVDEFLGALRRHLGGRASLEEMGTVIKAAVEEYKAIAAMSDKIARAEACADTLKAAHSTEELRAILGDMRAIAEADGTVTPDEESFIARIGARLGITAAG